MKSLEARPSLPHRCTDGPFTPVARACGMVAVRMQTAGEILKVAGFGQALST
jgi:hypothetical protein